MASPVAALLLIVTICLGYTAVTEGQVLMDCCPEVNERQFPKERVRGYQLQVKGEGCNIDAVIIVTINGMKLCVPPGRAWVNNVMIHVDHMTKKCLAKNFQGKQCLTWKPKSK